MRSVDRSARRSNRLIAAVLAGLGAFALVVVGVLALADRDGARETVSADLPDGVVAVIDGLEVTEIEWEIALAEVDHSLRHMRGTVALDEEESPLGPESQARFERQLELMEAQAPELVAFSNLLVTRATAAEAYARGLAPPEDEVVEAVEEDRRISEEIIVDDGATGPDGEPLFDPASRARIESYLEIADDRYWSEILPEWKRSALASHALFEAEVSNRVPDWPEQWAEYRHDLARDATVVLSPDLADAVSVGEAVTYLEALAEEPGEP